MQSSDRARLAVCVQHGAEVTAEFMAALRGLDVPDRTAFLFTSVRPIDAARNNLARRALETGAPWSLWLDSDTVFPSDLVRRLLAIKAPFASGVYTVLTGEGEPKVSAYTRSERGYHGLTPPYASEPVVEVDGVGFGCALISSELLRRTPEPWFAWTYGKHAEGVGEDFYFCERVAKATGIRPVVDLRLTVGHIKTRTLWPVAWSADAAPSAASAAEHA